MYLPLLTDWNLKLNVIAQNESNLIPITAFVDAGPRGPFFSSRTKAPVGFMTIHFRFFDGVSKQ